MDPGRAYPTEYEIDGELWKVSAPEALWAEYPDLKPGCLAGLHGMAASDMRLWRILSRLFGLQPVILPMDANPDDYRPRTRQELAAELGLTRQQLTAELDSIRVAVGRLEEPVVEVEPESERPEEKPPQTELKFSNDDVLDRFGYGTSMFEVDGRDQGENRRERDWFAGRVSEWSRILENPMAKSLAAQTLANELHLRRVEAELTRLSPRSKEYPSMLKLKGDIERTYKDQLENLDQIAPWMGAVGHKLSFAGVISDLVRAHQEYRSNGSTVLADGIFQATEIAVELRRSKQMPVPRYRAGLVAYLRAAKEGLWDPNWRSPFQPEQLKAVDFAFQSALAAGMKESGGRVPDLEMDGPEGEYDKIHE